MNPFEKFMLQAQGRDVDLEEKLKRQQATNVERLFRIVYGRDLNAFERRKVESLAAALNTTVDDDYVIHLFLCSLQGQIAIHVLRKIDETYKAIVEDGDNLRKIPADKTGISAWMSWASVLMIAASLLGSIWIAGTINRLSHQLDMIGASSMVRPQAGPSGNSDVRWR
ncbi:hypothetical protein [Methylorubrum populi]